MKFLFTFAVVCSAIASNAQKVIKYYDTDWGEITRDKAAYYAEFVKSNGGYKCTSFYSGTNTLRGVSTFPDTLMTNPIGLQLLYNKKGKLEDSIFFVDNKPSFLYHYHPNGKLAVHFYVLENKKEAVTEAFDEDGNKVKNYVVKRDADFKGGPKGWTAYLKKNLGKDLNIKDDKVTTATVRLQFTVSESGSITNAKVIQSSGIKEVDRDALKVVRESPDWEPAIIFNKPARALRLQNFTYDLSVPTKSK